ncbi:MAG: hypothetical protein OEY01_10465, partial [Desulfobulbaceae bacterium]|nr:hypothetical protein [Desulfobulbaceae bacterium]HIJ79373.1 hypothetical protein [Deltaproteobacteria bacterium]
IFVHDTQTNTTTRASVATGGVEATGGSSYNPAISDDGRYVVFQSSATDLVTGDTNGSQDIFVRDTLNNITKRISVDSGGYEANGWSDQPSISADGRYVLFNSSATNLVPDDTNGQNDIFIHDTHTGQTDFASTLLAGGVTASGAVFGGGNDRYLLLTTGTSLVGADTNGLNDAYLIDRNDAPDLDNSGAPALNAIAEDPVSNPGTSSYDMYMVLGDIISDADHKDNKMGIAVTGVDNTNGSWQYSTNGGSTWSNFTGVSDSSATLLKGPEELEAFLGNGADLATGDLLINSIDLGPVTLSTALINGRNMQGAMNLANAINAISGATGVVAELEPLYYGATAIGGNTASENITFDLNGVNVSAFIASGATTADVAIAVANAIMTVGYQAKVHAWVGDGTNGGGVDTVVIESYASSIEITNLSELGTAKSGLANGTYTADATHNGGEVFLLPTAGDYVVTTSAGDDSILHLLGLGGGSSFTGIAGDVADDGTIAVASPDNYIRFVPNADYNGTATLTFRAWDQSDGFTNDTSGIDVSVNGGSTAYSTASESLSITVTPVNDAPVLTTSAVLNYTENDIATPIAPSITLADIDNANLESAAINISANYVEGEDVLSFTPVGGITGSWDAPSATLLLSGIDTLANYQAALASVSYVNLSNNPSELARTISFTANDGAATSAAATATVNVTAANDPPSITVTGTLNYIEDAVPQVIDGAIVVSDVDNLSLTGADIIISPGYVLGEDQLGFSNTANITGSWDSATGILTLTGTDTVANYQAALRSVTYQNLSDNPSTGSRTVSFQVNDGGASASSSATVNVTAVNDAPVLDNSGAPALMAVMEDDNNPIGDLLSNLVASIISDADNPTPLGIAVTGADTADGIWQFSLDNGATWTTFGPLADTSATLLETDAFTRIRFVPTADFDETATFTFRAWDKSDALAGGASGVDVSINGGSTAYSAAVETASISITGINDAPTVSGTAGLGVLYLTDTDNGGDLVGNLISGVVNDVDTGAFKGIAVTGYDTAVGAWQYSLDNGATWLDFGPVAETAATLLADTAKIRLVPNGHDLGSSVITFHGWDQTSGSNGMTGVDVTINGGTTAFSTGATTATATVQELIVPPPATTTTTITTETTSTTLLIDTTTATSTTEILTEATTTDVLITEAEINTDSTMETASTEEAVEEAAESEDDGETADEGEEQAEDEADEEGEAEEEGKEEEAPEIVAAAEGEVNGEAEVKAAAEAGGKSGKGLSGQLAKEKKTSEAERAEIIKIFDEVFDLLQCK